MYASSCAIIGAGAAGLSMSKLLQEQGVNTVVYEASSRVGGKSLSLNTNVGQVEMGTCYTTLCHVQTKKWMKEEGIALRQLGPALFDGQSVRAYVNRGDGDPLILQIQRFVRKSAKLRKGLQCGKASALSEGALSTEQWLDKFGLPKIKMAMHRLQAAQGYGFLEETSIAQTIGWCSMRFILSGVFNQLHMPEQGWEEFWKRLSTGMDLRLNAPVTAVVRDADKVVISTKDGSQTYDAVVSCIPLDDFNSIAEPTALEIDIANSVSWRSYTTSLICSPDWFSDSEISAYSSGLQSEHGKGRLIGGRYQGFEEELGGHLYVTGQYHHGLSKAELQEILEFDAQKIGFSISALIDQRTWKYSPIHDCKAVEEGLFRKMKSVQGQQRTWHSGAIFSHELVSSIVAHNKTLIEPILAEIAQTTQPVMDLEPV